MLLHSPCSHMLMLVPCFESSTPGLQRCRVWGACVAFEHLCRLQCTCRERQHVQFDQQVDAVLWAVRFKDLKLERQIGEGSFGKVHLAKWRETTVAVKVLLVAKKACWFRIPILLCDRQLDMSGCDYVHMPLQARPYRL